MTIIELADFLYVKIYIKSSLSWKCEHDSMIFEILA